uniref:Arginase family protein n=1 Tax=Candidatus Kentrum sp. TUN TaxID=2126343 RepID=A0A451AHG3_9GAMM|nr:MAG: Arginase family protein [Candidatus Kentron sp. TUN]
MCIVFNRTAYTLLKDGKTQAARYKLRHTYSTIPCWKRFFEFANTGGIFLKKLAIIGVEMDLGQSRRGVDMGPNALRYAGLDNQLRQLGYTLEDYGNMNIMPLV